MERVHPIGRFSEGCLNPMTKDPGSAPGPSCEWGAPGPSELSGIRAIVHALTQAESETEACGKVLEALRERLDLPCSAVFRSSAAGTTQLLADLGLPDSSQQLLERSVSWPVVEGMPIHLVPTLEEDGPIWRVFVRHGVRSLTLLRLATAGTLFLGHRSHGPLRGHEREFALLISELLSIALQRFASRFSTRLQLPSSSSHEAWFKVFDLSPDAIDLTRLEDGVSLNANLSYLKHTGFAREEFIGHCTLPGDLGIWVRKEDRARHVADLKAHGQVFDFEAPLRRKDGSVYIGLISSALLEVDGQPCNLTFTRDITERKKAEEALLESAQRLELALASGNLGIWERNIRDHITHWDDRMFELYGLDRFRFKPDFETWLREVVHPDDVDDVRRSVRAAETGEKPYDLKFRIVRPDGSIRHIKSNGVVIRGADGLPERVIGINRDRTEQVEGEAERRRLQSELHHVEKLESIGSLAGGVAHDMNNVLAAILVSAETLREKCAEGDPMAKALDVILHAGGRGRDLVKALTDFARKGLGETSIFDLNEVVRKEVELLRQTTLKRVQVVMDLDASIPMIRGVASDLGGSIMNLSVNAVDAMPDGGTLTFRSKALPEGWVELTVSDTGHGMPPEVLTRAMEPFFTTKPVGKGTGLGLSRVYGTVRAHGGTLNLLSEAGGGTSVILRLPTGQEPEARTDAPGPSKPDAPTTSMRILLVDDEGIILETVPALLDALGHRVETASLGELALQRLQTDPNFDLVILDHNMPGMTGAETLVHLRRMCPSLPVLLSTGYMDAGTEDLLSRVPRVWTLKKPYSTKDLQRVLAEIAEAVAR